MEMGISLPNNNAVFVFFNCPFSFRPIDLPVSNNPSSLSILHKSQIQKSNACARTNKSRSVSQKSTQFVLDSMSIIASNPNILPESSNAFARRSGCSNGGLNLSSSISISGKIQTENSIICARRNRRRFWSRQSTKFMLQSMSIVVAKLNIFPEPVNVIIREFGGGNGGGGGGSGFLTGFGGGGFEGWRRRRRRKRKLGFFGFLIVCSLSLLLGQELDCDWFWEFLSFAMFGVSITFCNRGFQDWVLGFCCCLSLLNLCLGREKVQKWVEKFKIFSPLMEVVRRRRRKCRRRAM